MKKEMFGGRRSTRGSFEITASRKCSNQKEMRLSFIHWGGTSKERSSVVREASPSVTMCEDIGNWGDGLEGIAKRRWRVGHYV